VYQWELDGPAQQEFAALNPAVQATLAAFMDAAVIVDSLHTSAAPTRPMTRPRRCACCNSAQLGQFRRKMTAVNAVRAAGNRGTSHAAGLR
jgi:hypothetical protein